MPDRLLSLLLLLLATIRAGAVDWRPVLRTQATWEGNVTNSDRPADRLSDLQVRLDHDGRHFRQVTKWDGIMSGWHLGLESWARFEGLDAMTVGPTLGWRRKFGLGLQPPVIEATASGQWRGVRESGRSGFGGTVRLEARQRLGESWQFAFGTQRSRHDASMMAFDHSGRENSLRAEYRLTAKWQVSLEVRKRAGIVVSYTTPPRPDLVAAGKTLTLVDTFERGTPLLAYYFPADTLTGAIALTRDAGRSLSWHFGFEYRETTHGALRYLNQRTALGLARQF